MEASIEYLTGDSPVFGPCSMFSASSRFDRFREWINFLGGYVSPKVTFRRGYYVDPLTRKLSFSVGGLFLNLHEVLVPGEAIFSVPDRAIFHDRMILNHLPILKKFVYMRSTRLWMSIGLAVLLTTRPDIMGPWAALLPDMSYQPLMWPMEHIELLAGTPAYTDVRGWAAFISAGCTEYAETLSLMNISERQVFEAYGIIASRSFGLEVFVGDEPLAIPFGPDMLNHNPNTKSWISAVRWDDKVECLFYLQSYTLSTTRELFNNYGPHSLPTSMALYGFTSPNAFDELMFIATRDDAWNGEFFSPNSKNQCATNKNFQIEPKICPSRINDDFDENGYFRLVGRDAIFLGSSKFECNTSENDPLWVFAKRELEIRNVNIGRPENGYRLALNVLDGVEPYISHSTVAWMAICALPTNTAKQVVDQLVWELSTCASERDKRYFEEFPVSPHIRNIAKETLLDACKRFEATVTNTIQYNLIHWIAFRNIKRYKTVSNKLIKHKNVDVKYSTNDQLIALLKFLMANNHTVFYSEEIDSVVNKYHAKTSIAKADRMEEIYKYRLQTVYLLNQKCHKPLEKAITSLDFHTLLMEI